MTALAQLQRRLREVSRVLGVEITVTTGPGDDGGLHIRARGDRFDLIRTEKGAPTISRPLMRQEEVAFELAFEQTRSIAQAEEAQSRGAVYSRWNWMGPHIARMDRVSPVWGTWARDHYRRVLGAAPLSADEVAAICSPNRE